MSKLPTPWQRRLVDDAENEALERAWAWAFGPVREEPSPSKAAGALLEKSIDDDKVRHAVCGFMAGYLAAVRPQKEPR